MSENGSQSKSEMKITQHLYEAHAAELMVAQTLVSHIAMTPKSQYRNWLETHLKATREHARRLQDHLRSREAERGIVQVGYGVAQGMLSQVIAVSKLPFDLARGVSPEEMLLKNARDECANEMMEIAGYVALEQLAREVGDTRTAQLAASIRADEEKMLELLLKEIPRLATDVIGAEVDGKPQFVARRTGAVDAARFVATTAARTVAGSATRAARKVETEDGTPRPAGRRPVRKPAATTAAKPRTSRSSGKSGARSSSRRRSTSTS